jgi:Putative MetA-pathway of phenol degradation
VPDRHDRFPTRATQIISHRADFQRRLAVLFIFILAWSLQAWGQWIGKQTGCYADSIVANPNRPTVADPADITQYGVLELEYGWDRIWPDENTHQNSVGGLLKFGLLCDVEVRWNTTSFIWQSDSTGTVNGVGDNWIGPQIRIYKQTKLVPTLAFGYSVKIPSARSRDGLGSGQVDHSLTFLASKDIADIHFDFNATHFWIGQGGALGFAQNDQLNLAFSHKIYGPLLFTGEFYGNTELNSVTPGFASSLWALTYAVTPRLVIDGGFEAGITSGGPHRHAFAGLTYSIGNFYPGWRKRPNQPPGK